MNVSLLMPDLPNPTRSQLLARLAALRTCADPDRVRAELGLLIEWLQDGDDGEGGLVDDRRVAPVELPQDQGSVTAPDSDCGGLAPPGTPLTGAGGELTRAILDAMTAEIAILDGRGIIVAVNAAWRRFAEEQDDPAGQVPSGIAVGSDYLGVCRAAAALPDEGAVEAYEGIRAVLEGRSPRFTLDYPCRTPAEDLWFSMIVTPLSGGAGGAVVAHSDITAYRRAEAEIARLNLDLERRLAELQTILDTVPIGLAICDDPDGRRIRGNPAHERQLGLPPHSELSKAAPGPVPYRVFQNGAELPVNALPMQRAIRGEEVNGQIVEVVRPDGRTVILWCNASPLRDETDQPRGAVGAFMDITALRSTTAALHRSEARFRLLSSTAAKLLATEDPQGLVSELCGEVMAYLDCQVFFNYLVDPGSGWLRLNAYGGLTPAQLEQLRGLDLDTAVAGAVARESRPFLAEDIQRHPTARTRLMADFGIQAFCCHPLLMGERLLGTLSFGARTRTRFTADERNVMTIVADQVAVVLQRAQERAELQASEERYRSLVEQAVDGIFVSDGEGRYLDVNTAGAAMLGYTREELLKLSIADVIAPEETPRIPTEVARFDAGRVVLSEWRFRRKDGSELPGEVLGRRLPDGRLQAILRDISERRQAEAALKAVRDRNTALAGFIHNSSQPVAVGYPDGRIGLVNRAYEELTGYTEAELQRLDWKRALTPPEWQQVEVEELATLRRTGQPVRYEKEYIRKDGHRVPVELLVHFHDEPGDGSYFYAFLTDISERKHREQRRAMEESFRLLVARQTAAVFAHELNQPLTAIASYTEVARTLLHAGRPDPHKLRYALEQTESQAQRCGQVIRQFLDVLHQGDTTMEAVAVGSLLADAVALLRANDELGGFRVDADLAEDLPPVQINRLQIEKVLVNLLRNGLDALRENGQGSGTVAVSGRRAGADAPRMVQITVCDTGKGLTAEALKSLFQPFHSTKASGLGLGLAVSRALVETHGGKLWAEPNPDQGASFHFTLPFAP